MLCYICLLLLIVLEERFLDNPAVPIIPQQTLIMTSSTKEPARNFPEVARREEVGC